MQGGEHDGYNVHAGRATRASHPQSRDMQLRHGDRQQRSSVKARLTGKALCLVRILRENMTATTINTFPIIPRITSGTPIDNEKTSVA